MSIKIKTFEAMLGNPLNTHNFMVTIPAFRDIQLLVASTVFPSEHFQDYVLYFQGERVKFPTIPTNGGTWNCTMHEGELAKVYSAYKSYFVTQYSQITGKMTHWSLMDKFDIRIAARGLRGDVNGSDEVFATNLMGCYLTGRNDVTLNNQAATQSWDWVLTFSFDYIKDELPTPLPPITH